MLPNSNTSKFTSRLGLETARNVSAGVCMCAHTVETRVRVLL